eukprot:scaffold50786_cov35-Attheya_sp.AAC.1
MCLNIVCAKLKLAVLRKVDLHANTNDGTRTEHCRNAIGRWKAIQPKSAVIHHFGDHPCQHSAKGECIANTACCPLFDSTDMPLNLRNMIKKRSNNYYQADKVTTVNMADLASCRALMVHLRFSLNAAATIVDEEGIDSLDEIKILTDDDIESLCKVVHHAGGSIPNPDVNVAGQPATIRASGESVSMVAEVHMMRELKDYYEKGHADPSIEPEIDP